MKYIVTIEMQLEVEAKNSSEANEKALDAELNRKTERNGVIWQGSLRKKIETKAEHQAYIDSLPKTKWHMIGGCSESRNGG